MEKPVIVSVRLSDADLRKLQLLAQVYQSSVGELIRTAVGKHVEELTRTEEFKAKAFELQKRNEETLNELLEPSGTTSGEARVVRSFPRNTAGSNASKLSIVDPGSPTDRSRSLVEAEVFHVVGSARLGAAASHKTAARASSQRRFQLTWKQGERAWTMQGISIGNTQELVLSCTDDVRPEFLVWKNSATGSTERFDLTTTADGRILITGISLVKALKRVEAVRDTAEETTRGEMLPIVHVSGEDS